MVNGVARHSDQLMGITAYGHPNFNEVAAQQLVRELDIRSIGIQAIVTNFAPPNLTLSALRTWFTKDNKNGSSPALRYISQHQPALVELIASHGIRTAGATPWIYLKTGDGVKCDGNAAEGHCFAVAGSPKPDDGGDWSWWSTLFVGSFRVLQHLDPSLTYVHLWNEPNAHFWKDKLNGVPLNGSWFAEFYRPVAEALKDEFPKVKLGGPVTYSPPFQEKDGYIIDKTWEEWIVPLLRRTADRPELLGWIDYHGYDAAHPHDTDECDKPNCVNADAKTIDLNLQEAALLSASLGRKGLRSAITETNFQLANASDQFDWTRRFSQRGLALSAQTMALLRQPDKVLTRQLFDWGVPVNSSGFYRFLPPNVISDPFTPEMEVYKAFANFSDGLRLTVTSGTSAKNVFFSEDELQVEAVCVDRSAVRGHDSKPPNCKHAKIALLNGGSADQAVDLRVKSMSNDCSSRVGVVTTLSAAHQGPQHSVATCSNSSERTQIPAGSLVVVDCRCA
jgi:hypothetical protein